MGVDDFVGLTSVFWGGIGDTLEAKPISKWSHLFPNLQQSALEYYAAVEEAIERRKIPEAEMTRVTWKEGGLLSARREYLRVTRKRYVYDLCAAPFGTGFFFSGWMVINPPALNRFHILGMATTVLCLALFAYLASLGENYGYWACAVMVLLCGVVLWLLRTDRLRKVIGSRLQIEDFLLGMTVVGAIHDRYLRKMTYFELDTAGMFEKSVHGAMMEVIDGITQAKALRPMTEDERRPILGDFFKL